MHYLLPRIEEIPFWPTISGTVFLLLFIVFTWWTYRPSRKALYKEIGEIPFNEDHADLERLS